MRVGFCLSSQEGDGAAKVFTEVRVGSATQEDDDLTPLSWLQDKNLLRGTRTLLQIKLISALAANLSICKKLSRAPSEITCNFMDFFTPYALKAGARALISRAALLLKKR
jgi:hypothetical protein